MIEVSNVRKITSVEMLDALKDINEPFAARIMNNDKELIGYINKSFSKLQNILVLFTDGDGVMIYCYKMDLPQDFCLVVKKKKECGL